MQSEDLTNMTEERVIEPGRDNLVATELRHLAERHGHIMAENDEYVVLRATADHIPNTLHEIGRLRDEIYPEAGTGTGKGVDLDYFDLYYLHMVIWNKKAGEIAGSCRVGQVDIILKRFGHDGLATGARFRYSPLFLQETGPALELGKFFVRRKYRGHPAPAALLWKGIGYFVSYNPHYRALIASASICERYSHLSRDLILSFLKRNIFARKTARLVEPLVAEKGGRSGPRPRTAKTHLKSLGALSRIISGIETGGRGIPADLKHYVKLGGKLIGYNDRSPYRSGLDVLMFIDIMKCGSVLLHRSMGKDGTDRFFDYHGGRNCRAA